jgi:hypothetical protein
MNRNFYYKLTHLFIFAISFAFIEASVVIYLRAIYYPQGFRFPLIRHYDIMLLIELIREFSTLIIIITAAALVSRKFWEGFGYFLIIFGVWDIFFYIWLKAVIRWPESPFTFDVLFLIPVPWIAPVLAPVLVSLVMVLIGFDIVRLYEKGYFIKPLFLHWFMVLAGTAIIFFSFMSDTGAGFYGQMPEPYNWFLFATGMILYITAYMLLRYRSVRFRKFS